MSEHEASSETPSVPLHWRARVCRSLWRGLAFVWGTLIVGIVIATIANLNTTTTNIPLAELFIVHLAQTYPLPVWSSLGFLAALTLLSWLGSRDKQVLFTRPLSEQGRIHMLRRLRMRYGQILAQSLQGAVQVELGLASRPAAVQNAVSLAMRVPDQPEHLLPPHTSIVQAYELAQHELLILGEPGAGKSTLLVELAHYLVEQAEQNATHPLPILLPLSSWAEQKRPLDEWLREEIARLYDVPRRFSQQWVETALVLPLLDGLDEMREDARPACITAINAYHREHVCPLVVCSRTSEYEKAVKTAVKSEQLVLHTAVVVQPLELKQVNAYLASLGKPLAGLHAASKTNILLQELATTPLMLQVLMLTYYDTSVRGLSQREALLREQIWTDYVQRAVERKGDKGRYPLPVTIGWLGYLAREMRQHNQVIFYLEQLQPGWLPEKQRNRYLYSAWLFLGLLFGLGVGLVGGPGMGLVGGLVFWLLFVWARGWGAEIEATKAKEKLAKKKLPEPWYLAGPDLPEAAGLHDGLYCGLFGGLIAGLFLGLIAGLLAGLGVGLFTRLLAGLRVGLGVGLLVWLIGMLGIGLLAGWFFEITGSFSEMTLSLLKFTVCPRDTQRDKNKQAEMQEVIFGTIQISMCHTESVLR